MGPVRRSRADAVWQRFRTACSGFLERYDQREQAALAANLAERGALCRQLEEMLASGADAAARPAPEGLADKVQGIRRDWRQAAELPRTQADVFTARFTSLMARLLEVYPESFRGTDLDPGTNLRKLEELCARVEGHLASAWGGDEASASPAEVLASRWREALAANTMGVRVDEDAKWREAAEVVKRAQAERNRLGLLCSQASEAGSSPRDSSARATGFLRNVPAEPRRDRTAGLADQRGADGTPSLANQPVRRRTIIGARFASRANDDHNHHSAVACYAARQTSNDELLLGKVRQS